MGRIKGQVFGDIRGKVGGVVFTRANSGKMVRARVQPTDAKSAAQVKTRGLFANSAGLWNSLTVAIKRAWGTYATTIFRSKNHKKGSVASGYMSFASANFALNLANSKFLSSVFTPTTMVCTTEQVNSFVQNPPVDKFGGFGTNTAGEIIPIRLVSADFSASDLTFKAHFLFPNGEAGVGFKFQNSSDSDPFSLSLYLTKSESSGYVGGVGKGIFYIGNTGSITCTTIAGTEKEFEVAITIPQEYMDSIKNSFPEGSVCYVSCYAVSSSGQFSNVGTIKTVILT